MYITLCTMTAPIQINVYHIMHNDCTNQTMSKNIQILFDINTTTNNIDILLYIYIQNTRIGKYEF